MNERITNCKAEMNVIASSRNHAHHPGNHNLIVDSRITSDQCSVNSCQHMIQWSQRLQRVIGTDLMSHGAIISELVKEINEIQLPTNFSYQKVNILCLLTTYYILCKEHSLSK